MNNELKRCTLESLDDITDKIHDGTLFEGENEKLIKKLLFEEYAKMHIEGKKIGKCVCPNCCNKSIKRSHTIPRGMSLDIIAENKKVVMPIFVERYPVREYFIEAAEIGIGQASTFPGFCKKHELIFQTYEKRQEINIQDDVIKQLFRNVTYNCFILERRIELSKNIIERYKDIRNQAAYNYLKKSELKGMLKEVIISGEDKNIINLTFHQQKLIDYYTKLEKYKMNLWKIIAGSDADITSISVILDVLFPVSICGCTEIVFDDSEYVCSIDVVPSKKETLVTIGFYGEISSELYDIVKSRLNLPLTILNFIESTMVYGTDNWYLNPKVWTMLSDKRKERLISEMQNLGKSIFDEVPYSIFDDIRRYIVLNLGLKKKNIEHELEKMKI